jgi:hypothetical protein
MAILQLLRRVLHLLFWEHKWDAPLAQTRTCQTCGRIESCDEEMLWTTVAEGDKRAHSYQPPAKSVDELAAGAAPVAHFQITK